MEFRLPQLEWQGAAWRLPLCPESAAELAEALLADPVVRVRKLAELLHNDRSLLLWVVCRAPYWRDAPPTNAQAATDWLLHSAILGGLIEPLDSDSSHADRRNDGGNAVIEASLANAGDQPAESPGSLDNWASQALNAVWELFGASGPPLDREAMRACPWFPTWLPVGERARRAGAADSRPPGSSAATAAGLAAQLPRIIELVRRLHSLETEFAAALEREKIAAMRELAYGASHEINNPLANIATRAQALLREESHPERQRKLATIAAQAFRAYEMIADMMLFAKPPPIARQPVDLVSVVEAVIREVQPDADSQETRIVWDGSQQLVANVDATQIGVAVKALVRNAMEALAAGGQIDVAVRGTGPDSAGISWVEVEVRDSGPGIGAETRRHLFDPFYSGREAGRGLGFGLPKCWTIAQLHNGEIGVESQLGSGATFTLRLPRT